MAPSPSQARAAAIRSWALTDDRTARTQNARDGFLAKFEQQVDPGGRLPYAERQRRAEDLRRAHMIELAIRSVNARRAS